MSTKTSKTVDLAKPVPAIITRFYNERRWPELIWMIRENWNYDAWQALRKNEKAVERVKKVFSETFGRPAFSSLNNRSYWMKQIAKYVDRLGVASLIDDMREAKKKNPNIQSILYFIYSADHVCRWEMLLLKRLEAKYQQEKKEENDTYAAIARVLGEAVVKKVDEAVAPEWVVTLRARRKALKVELKKHKTHQPQYKEFLSQILRIEQSLAFHGFDLE